MTRNNHLHRVVGLVACQLSELPGRTYHASAVWRNRVYLHICTCCTTWWLALPDGAEFEFPGPRLTRRARLALERVRNPSMPSNGSEAP